MKNDPVLDMAEAFGVRPDMRYVNRKNKKYGYEWVPDAVVDDFKNRQKQKPTYTFSVLMETMQDVFSKVEAKMLSPEYQESGKKHGATLEKYIALLEHLFPLSRPLVQPYKDKLYQWDKEGKIE